MSKKAKLLTICPVLSTDNLNRDIKWYEKYVGFKLNYLEEGYAVLNRDTIWLHLKWHHNDKEDPIYGSVVKIFVADIYPVFEEMIERGTITKNKLRLNTSWETHEFGFYDLNKNAIFFVQNV